MVHRISDLLSFPRLAVGLSAVVIGISCAAYAGYTDLLSATVFLLFTMCVQLYSHVKGCQMNMRRAKEMNSESQIFSKELLTLPYDRILSEVASAFVILGAMLWLTLVAMTGWWMVIMGIAVAALLAAYIRFSRPMLGSVARIIPVFLFFGPLVVICTTLIETLHLEPNAALEWSEIGPAITLSIGSGSLACNVWLSKSYASHKDATPDGWDGVSNSFGLGSIRILYFIFNILFLLSSLAFYFLFRYPNFAVSTIIPILIFIGNCVILYQMSTYPYDRLSTLYHRNLIHIIINAASYWIVFSWIGDEQQTVRIIFGG